MERGPGGMAPTLRLDAAGGELGVRARLAPDSNCACAMSLPRSERLGIFRGRRARFPHPYQSLPRVVLLIAVFVVLELHAREGNH